ncbi:MAG: DUF4224 domain-containing protein [Burkholderiaceae bacterium]
MVILSDEQIVELTRRKRRSSQQQQLRALGIPFRLRTDGSIVVFEHDLVPQAQKARPAPVVRPLPSPIKTRSRS